MKKLFTFIAVICLATTVSAQYQVGNSDFETTWTDTDEPGNGWYSFPSARTSDLPSYMQKLAISNSRDNTVKLSGDEARNRGTSVRLISRFVGFLTIGANANGNLTTGRINMGSTTPKHEKNYNYSARNTSNSCQFSGRPDGIEFYYKYTRGEDGTYNGLCRVILHGDIDYKDPYETQSNESTYKIAEAKVYATPSTTWTRCYGELDYTGVEHTTSYMLVNFTTNETPGGSKGDIFDIDDIKFIYYSELASATYNGNAISFNGTSATVNEYFDASKLNITSNGHGAKVETSMNEATQLLTVTIKGDNISEDATNFHTYTIQFKKPYAQGDVNMDGSVTIADVTALVNIILGKGGDDDMADVNGDGGVTIADVTALVNIILGKN